MAVSNLRANTHKATQVHTPGLLPARFSFRSPAFRAEDLLDAEFIEKVSWVRN